MNGRRVTVALSTISCASLAYLWYLYVVVVPKIMEALWITSTHQNTPTQICQTLMHTTEHHQVMCIGASLGTILLTAFLTKNNSWLAKACLVNLTLGLLILAGFPHLALPGCLPYEKGLTGREPDLLDQHTLSQTYRLANRIVAFRNSQSTH